MCTVGFVRLPCGTFLFKNRDLLKKRGEEIAVSERCIGIMAGADNYVTALNSAGIAFASTTVMDRKRLAEVYSLPLEGYKPTDFPQNIKPTTILSKAIKNPSVSIRELLKTLKENAGEYKASTITLCNRKKCYEIETVGDIFVSREVKSDRFAKSNHFVHIPTFGPQKRGEYPSSFERLSKMKELISGARNLRDIILLLRNHEGGKENSICRHGKSKTVSSVIIDLNGVAYYAKGQPCKNNYAVHVLSNQTDIFR